jgi:hypothetical protein
MEPQQTADLIATVLKIIMFAAAAYFGYWCVTHGKKKK